MGLNFLGALGGVGKGVMIGADQIRRQEAHDATLAAQQQAQSYRDDMLKIQQDAAQRSGDEHGVRMDAAKKLQEEQDRAKTNQTLYTRIQSEYADRPEYEREQMYFDNALKLGVIRPDELTSSKNAYNGMVKRFGVEAFDEAVINGNPAKLQKLFKDQGLGDLQFDGRAFTVAGPAGTMSYDRRGLMQIHALNGVLEREAARQKAAIDAAKDQSIIDKNNRMYGMVQNPDGSVSYMGRPGGGGNGGKGAKSGNGSGKSADEAPSLVKNFKDPVQAQEFFQQRYAEGLTIDRGQGDTVTLPKGEAAAEAFRYADDLIGENPGLSLGNAGQIADEIIRYRHGMPTDKGVYAPQPYLDPKTLKWKTVMRSKDGIEVFYPSPVIQPTEQQVFDQEAKAAITMVDSGEATKFASYLKSPETLRAVAQALSNPAKRAAIEAAQPDFFRKLEILYTHTGLDGVVVPDIGLIQRRTNAQRIRGAGVSSPSAAAPATPGFNEADRQRAKERGVSHGERVGEKVAGVAREMGQGLEYALSGVGNFITGQDFGLNLAAFRESPGGSNAAALVKMLRANPELKKKLTDDELFDIQFIAKERIN